jgi:hypothetical protein
MAISVDNKITERWHDRVASRLCLFGLAAGLLLGGCDNNIQITMALSKECADSTFAEKNPEKCPQGAQVSLVVPVLSFEAISPALGLVGTPITITPSALSSKGRDVTACSIEPALPAGLDIAQTTCVISGTPQTPSSGTYNVLARNLAGPSAPASLEITINAAAPLLGYEGETPATGNVGSSLTITPSTLISNGADITACVADPALPPELTISQTTCAISGVPSDLSSGTYNIIATNSAGSSAPASVAITVGASAPVVSYVGVTPALGSVGQVIIISPTTLVNSGADITACSAVPSLPAGLTISPTLCVVSGTPVSTSSRDYKITAVNAVGVSTAADLVITINPATPIVSFAAVTPTTGSVGHELTITPSTLSANGSSISACAVEPALPAGLSISQTTCEITGIPEVPSAQSYNVTASNSAGLSAAASLTINISPSVPILSYAGVTPAAGSVGSSMTIMPTTLNSNGAAITSCEASPSLPSGLLISPSLCVISGTPVVPAVGTYSIIATNSAGASTAASLSLNIQAAVPVVSFAGVSPALGEFGSVITITPSILEANGAAITSCSIDPALPAGLSMHPTLCVVSGTPEGASSGVYSLTAANSVGVSSAASLVITINALPPVLSFEGVSPAKTYVGSVTSVLPTNLQQNGAPVTACNVDPALPAGLSIDQSTCVISGTPTAESSTSYSVTAINSGGSSTPATVTIAIHPQPPEGTCYIAGMAHPGLDANCTGLSATNGKFYINSSLANGYVGGGSNTVLLMHMDTSTGASQFVDSSVAQKNLAANGTAQITTSDLKFGSGSGQFDGGSSVTIENPGDELKFTGAFTMEMWAKLNDPSQRQFFVYSVVAGGGDNYGFGLERAPDGRPINGISFFWGYWGWYGFWLHTSYIPPAGEWHHYAVTRDSSNTWRIFIDGVATDYQVWEENYSYDPAMPLYGSSEKLIGYMVNGKLDELRITNGSAVYTTNFTPPITAFDPYTGCYANGINTNEIGSNGSGWCSGNNKYYLRGQETTLNQAGTGTFNGKDYIEGVRIISVSSSGSDSGEGSQNNPFASAQKAFQEAYAESGSVVIKLGEGSFGGVDLGTANAINWPSRITVQGVSASSSYLGGIIADGTKNVTIIGDGSVNLGDVNASRSGWYGGNGGSITLTNVTAGSISSSGAPNWNWWEPSSNGGSVTISNSTVGAINAIGGDYYGNGGNVTLLNSTAGDITTNSGSSGGIGGTITLTNSTAGSVSSTGSSYDGNGGSITLTNSTATSVSSNGGSYNGNGGSVTLNNSSSGDITAKGGQSWGSGGTVSVTDSGFGTINVDGSPAGTISYYGVNRYMVNGSPFSGVFANICYSDGFSTSDLNNGTGICSSDGKYYANGALGIGYFNGVYHVMGIATNLDSSGNGVWNDKLYVNGLLFSGDYNGVYYLEGLATGLNTSGSGNWMGVYYINGAATTLDSAGSGVWGFDVNAAPNVNHLPVNGFVDSAVADEIAAPGNYVWTASRWGSPQKLDILTGSAVSNIAIPNGVELVKSGDYIWALRVGSSGAYRVHRTTDVVTSYGDSHFTLGYGVWASDGYLWLSDPSSPILKKVDGNTGELVSTTDLSGTLSGSIRSIKGDSTKLAVVAGTRLAFLDKASLAVIRIVDLPSEYNFNPSETWLMATGNGAWFLSGGGGGGKTIYRYSFASGTSSYVDISLDSIEGCAVNSNGFWVASTWGSAFYHVNFDGTVDKTIDLGQFGISSYPKTRVAVGETVWISTYQPQLHLLNFAPRNYSGGVSIP